MLVNEMLKMISEREGVSSYKQIPLERYINFNNKDIKSHISFDEDKHFEEFHRFLNSIFNSKVYRNVTVKILKNGYLIDSVKNFTLT